MTQADIARLRALAAAEVPHINDVYDLRELDLPKLLDAMEARDAELVRLRALVEFAFKQGNGRPSPVSDEAGEREWQRSDARALLDAPFERHEKHPSWWRATLPSGRVVTKRDGEPWDGYATCWCLQDGPHERECEQGLYWDPVEDDNPVY